VYQVPPAERRVVYGGRPRVAAEALNQDFGLFFLDYNARTPLHPASMSQHGPRASVERPWDTELEGCKWSTPGSRMFDHRFLTSRNATDKSYPYLRF